MTRKHAIEMALKEGSAHSCQPCRNMLSSLGFDLAEVRRYARICSRNTTPRNMGMVGKAKQQVNQTLDKAADHLLLEHELEVSA